MLSTPKSLLAATLTGLITLTCWPAGRPLCLQVFNCMLNNL